MGSLRDVHTQPKRPQRFFCYPLRRQSAGWVLGKGNIRLPKRFYCKPHDTVRRNRLARHHRRQLLHRSRSQKCRRGYPSGRLRNIRRQRQQPHPRSHPLQLWWRPFQRCHGWQLIRDHLQLLFQSEQSPVWRWPLQQCRQRGLQWH